MAKATKQARLVKASSRPASSMALVDTRPQFSREMALHWLDGIDEQLSNVASLAIGGRSYQETRVEEDPVMISFMRVIQQQADDSVQIRNELRTMLEKLPKDVPHA